MRKPVGKRTPRASKRQPKASQVSDGSVEIVDVIRDGLVVGISFKTEADAKAFYAEFKLQMEVDTFLSDMPEDSFSEGVLRTIKVKK